MCAKQCSGITKKGTRCLKQVNAGELCHFHIGQTPGKFPIHTPAKVDLPRYTSPTRIGASLPQPRTPTGSPKKSSIFFTSPKESPVMVPRMSMSSLSSSLSSSPKKTSFERVARPPSASPRPNRPLSSSKKELSPKPGYIYVYTLASLLNKNNAGGWLKTRNLLNNPNDKDKWVDFNARKLEMLLVKVGMTTQTVSKRILQWEAKCNHKIECLYPSSPKDPSQPLSLARKFQRLTLKNWTAPLPYQSFQENAHGFFVPRDVMRAEKQIHDLLKLTFGRGDVYCTGCVAKAQEQEKGFSLQNLFKKKEFVESDYNVHVEWFPIPKKRMKEVYSIIDSVCLKYVP